MVRRILGPTALALAACALAALPLVAQSISRENAQQISSLDGAQTYDEYCAVCHGKEGKGDGPAAPALKAKTVDLTTLAKEHGGTFPRSKVEASILGTDRVIPAHGTVDMPVWGPVFKNIDKDDGARVLRLNNLLDFIERMQVK
ncbi:MAG: c-type cytochrome [Vicinamibacteraceae bacterium]|nr:c-type cytochrome [Vicinamibacteraceae bacterium]